MKLFLCLFAIMATAMAQSNEMVLQTSNNQFTANMFQEVLKANPGENIVLSAFSVLSPLAQLALASVGDSHDEILKAIGFPNDNVIKDTFSDVSKKLQGIKSVELKLANKIYIRKEDTLNEEYAVVSRNIFNSDVKNVDFTKSAETALEINTWVEDNTNHRIKDVVSSDMFGGSTTAILVNAIYFKGKWKVPFDRISPKRIFYVNKDKIINIHSMTKTAHYKYSESKELDAKLLELAYEGDQASLVVVLPNEIEGLASLLEKLKDPLALSKATGNMTDEEVEVQLPQFKIETATDLQKVLEKMNIVKLFRQGQARLDNMLKGPSDMYITSAIQKTYIEVNEEGTEATVLNGMAAGFVSAMFSTNPNRKEFKVNRPFYFALIIDNKITFNGIFLK